MNNKPNVQQLLSQIEYATEHSPYYKSLIGSQTIDASNVLEIYKNLKPLEKSDICGFEDNFLAIDHSKVAEIVTTSGTTGSPMTMYLSKKDINRLGENELFSYQTIGLAKNDTIQITTTLDKLFMAGMAYYKGAIEIGATVLRVGPGNPAYQWQNILKHKVTTLVTVPSFLKYMVEYAQQNNIDYQNTSIKKVLCIGQPIRNEKLEYNSLASSIKDNWDIELYSTYASTEMATAYTECTDGKGVHANEDLIYTEVLDSEGNPAAEGELGEVVVTPLKVEAMPFIKFATGDLCHVYYETCACGKKGIRLGSIVGRKNQLLKLKGTSIFPSSITGVLESFKEIKIFVVKASSDEFGNDKIEVLLPEEMRNNSFIFKKITNAFKSNIRVIPEISFVNASEIVNLTNNTNIRKKVNFIDYRQ